MKVENLVIGEALSVTSTPRRGRWTAQRIERARGLHQRPRDPRAAVARQPGVTDVDAATEGTIPAVSAARQ